MGEALLLTLWPSLPKWQSASDEDWALALAREAVIRPLTDQPEATEGLVVTASAELGISRSMVYRLVAKFRKRPQVSSLLPGKRGRKASARALSVAAEAVVRDAITDVYLQPEKPRLSDLLREISATVPTERVEDAEFSNGEATCRCDRRQRTSSKARRRESR